MAAPQVTDAELQHALLLHRQGRLADAVQAYESILARVPTRVDALQMLGLAHIALGQPQAALAPFESASQLAPSNAGAHFNRGLTLLQLQRADDALAALEAALRLDPRHAKALQMKASTLHALGRLDEALAAFLDLLRLQPDEPDHLVNAGSTLIQLGRHAEAVPFLQRAVQRNPQAADTHYNLGLALAALGRPGEAAACYADAVRLAPELAVAWAHLGNVLLETDRVPEAIAAMRQLLEVEPRRDFARDALLQARMRVCDWTGFESALGAIEQAVEDRSAQVSPTRLFAVSDSPLLLKRCAEDYALRHYPAMGVVPAVRRSPGPLRVGYFGADFHAHATAFLMARVFELHDRQRFHTIAYSWGHPPRDAMHERLRLAFTEFHDVSGLADEALAAFAREHRLDIAVDLKGLSRHGRPRVFAQRVAPLQVAYLAYPMTMGSACIDYLVADASLVPHDRREHYTEKVLSLPGSYQANDDTREVLKTSLSRAQAGLPEEGFVFCSFNSVYKVTPRVFDAWMRILKAVPGSVLWQLAGHPVASDNLRREAQARGVAPERLVFAPIATPGEHLARQALADLFLDTRPCNAHTTASDALWAGLPVLTCTGETFAGRVATSLVRAAGLPEMAVASLDEYERTAIQLATQPDRLRPLRERLAAQRGACALFDSERFTRRLERGFELIHARAAAGLAPDHVDVPDL
jgi:protein O-GlcNAc transferase